MSYRKVFSFLLDIKHDGNQVKPEEDAVGQFLSARYNGKDSHEVIEREDGYIDAMSTKAYFSEHKDWPPHEQKSMEFVKGKVLDVGCGAGRHSLYLQEKGFDVLGIDISPLAVKVCKLRGLEKAEVMSIEELNLKPDSFDTILMMGNNFGLFGNYQKARRLLKRFHKMTSSNARIIAATNDVSKTENPFHLEYQEFNRKRGRMRGQIKWRIRFQKYATPRLDYLMVSKEEMEEILQGTGWKVTEYVDSEGVNYIAIIEKGAE